MTLEELMRDGNYLPVFMRDFHAQKNLFKRIDEIVKNSQSSDEKDGKGFYSLSKELPNWTIAHIYVVDYFLWHMARCGYTLQKTRHATGDFVDVVEDCADFRKRQMKALKATWMNK